MLIDKRGRLLFSRWPPNSNRMADKMRLANSSLPREAKRSNSAELSTGTGTPSSIAAARVHRPSPESETYLPLEVRQVRTLEQRVGGQVEQPRANDAAAAPQLGHVRQVEVVLVQRGIAERRRLRVDLALRVCNALVMPWTALLMSGAYTRK